MITPKTAKLPSFFLLKRAKKITAQKKGEYLLRYHPQKQTLNHINFLIFFYNNIINGF